MTTLNTGNPVGSVDPRDLYDNAENLDNLVNHPTKTEFQDRLGVPRKTWHGMEQDFQQFLVSSGYTGTGAGGAYEDYEADGPLTIDALNEIFTKDGEFYRLKPDQAMPYTTTTWATDEANMVAIGDATLRNELAQNGGSMVGVSTSTGTQTLNEALSYRISTIRTTAQLEDAISNGGNYYVAPGSYVLNGSYTVPDNLSLSMARGALINANDEVVLNCSGNFYLHGGEFDYSAQVAPGSFTAFAVIGSGGECSITRAYLHDCQRSMMEIIGFNLAEVSFTQVSNTGLEKYNSGISNIGAGIIIRDCTKAITIHNIVRNTFASSIFIWGTTPGAVLAADVSNNIVDGSFGNGVRIQSDDSGREGVQFANVVDNIIKDCDSHGIRANYRKGCVSNNTIHACNIGIVTEVMADLSFQGNIITQCLSAGIYGQIRYAFGAERLSITGNVVSNIMSGNTIGVISFDPSISMRSVNIKGNSIACNTSAGVNGIAVNGGAGSTGLRVNIEGNTIEGASANAAQVDNALFAAVTGNTALEIASGSLAYFIVNATRTVISGNTGFNQNASDVSRPVVIGGNVTYSAITNNVLDTTTSGYISYNNSPNLNRYEAGNVTAISKDREEYSLSGVSAARAKDLSTATTAELGEVIYAIVQDLNANRFISL